MAQVRVLQIALANVLLQWTTAWTAPLCVYHNREDPVFLATLGTVGLWVVWIIVNNSRSS